MSARHAGPDVRSPVVDIAAITRYGQRNVSIVDSAPWLVPFAIAIVAGVLFARAIRRSTELFVLEVDSGDVRFTRGRIPPQLLDEIREILRRSGSNGVLRIVQDRREAVIEATGNFGAGTLQQLRNVIGNTPLQRIRSGVGPRR